MPDHPRVLTIAGSDSGGGAGIEADIKTVTALGGYAMTAITALTAQNTLGVAEILPIAPQFVRRAIDTVLADIGADAIKIGMLGAAAMIEAVAASLPPAIPIVLDPVLVATSGARLLPEQAIAALIATLLPKSTLLTPNLPEAEALTGLTDPRAAAEKLHALGAGAILVKGGHAPGEDVIDLLFHPGGVREFRHRRAASRHTHGTGCTLSAAIATLLGAGVPLSVAVARAITYVQGAIAHAPGFGAGNGPLGHWPSQQRPSQH